MTRQTRLSAFHLPLKFLTCYLIFYRNGITQIENADKVGISSSNSIDPWP